MAIAALLRFHLATSARAALRLQAPLAAVAVAGAGLSSGPDGVLREVALVLGARAGPAGPLVATAVALGLAASASRAAATATRGWMGSLPASAREARRAGCLAIAVVLIPWLVVVAFSVTAAEALGADPAWSRLAGLPALAMGAALAIWPSPRGVIVSLVAIGAAALAMGAGWAGVAASVPLLLIAEHAGREPARTVARTRPAAASGATASPARLALRSLGARGVASAWALGALPLLAMAIARVNNPGMAPSKSALLGRLGAIAAMAVVAFVLSASLAARRAPWAWSRTLPMSSWRRAGEEAAVIAALALPVAIAAGALLGPAAALIAIAASPWLAWRAAAWSRPEPGDREEGLGAMEAALAACAMAMAPWLVAVSVMASPAAAWAASRRDRAWRVTTRDDLRELARAAA